jgi:WD40-like Beta Propeller Repeat
VAESTLEGRLRALRAPDEGDAALRAWELAAAQFERAEPAPTRGWPARRVAVLVAAALCLVGLAISPAGAKVAHWVGDRFSSPGVKHARPALASLPAPGRLLVTSRDGAWIVQPDGSKRLLGPYRDAVWSPRGLFVAAVRGHELLAVDPRGRVRWTVSRSLAPRHPSWSPGDGFRVAYLSGGSLRVVAGDGSGDRPVALGVAAIAPAWRPGPAHVLSYWTTAGGIVTRDVDSGRVLWSARAGDSAPVALEWSANGRTLMVLGRHRLTLISGGAARRSLPAGAGRSFTAADISPDGRTIAVARFSARADQGEVMLVRTRVRGWHAQRLFGGAGQFSGVRWSPDGRWLLVTWRDADQWLFLRSTSLRGLVAVRGIGRAFEPDRRGTARFPRAGGWCCKR